MRTIKFEEWKQRKQAVREALIKLEGSFEGRAVGRRPRDSEKERVLARMDRARKARYIETGKLMKLGPRHWKWNIGD